MLMLVLPCAGRLVPSHGASSQAATILYWSGAGVSAERPTRAPTGDALANRGLTHAFEPGIAELIASYYRRQVSPPFYVSHTDGDFYDYIRAASQPQLGPSDLTPQNATSCRSTTISSGSTRRAAADPKRPGHGTDRDDLQAKPALHTPHADQILDSLAAYCQRINDSGH